MHFKHRIILDLLAKTFAPKAIVAQQGCHKSFNLTDLAAAINRELSSLHGIRDTVANLQHRRMQLYDRYLWELNDLESGITITQDKCNHHATYSNGTCKVCGFDTRVEVPFGMCEPRDGPEPVEPKGPATPINGPVILNMTIMEHILGGILVNRDAMLVSGDNQITPHNLARFLVDELNALAEIERQLAESKDEIIALTLAFSKAKDKAEAQIEDLQRMCSHAAIDGDSVCYVCGYKPSHKGR